MDLKNKNAMESLEAESVGREGGSRVPGERRGRGGTGVRRVHSMTGTRPGEGIQYYQYCLVLPVVGIPGNS